MQNTNKKSLLKKKCECISPDCENKHISKLKIKELKFEIKSCRDSIKRLFAFATGEKRIKNSCIPSKLRKEQRTEADDRMMFKTVAYLREKIERLEQEIITLRKR